jgi:predicted enzyme related to lactoylglutathione lyase
MGTRTSYTPGTFSWVDLGTTDPAAARAFYTSLFGWQTEDTDSGDGSVYTVCRLGDDAVCALYEMPADLRATGAPPSWTSYVTVERVDDAAARALELGGTVISKAFDVLDAGRMALLADPHGAVFAVWQPRAQIGAERVNDVGCLCMNELATNEIEEARAFYEALFGWTTEQVETGPGGPVIVSVNNRGSLNATLSEERVAPPHWRPYFTVDSVAMSMSRARDLGADALLDLTPIGDGSIGIVRDPQGAVFGLFEGEVDP